MELINEFNVFIVFLDHRLNFPEAVPFKKQNHELHRT